MKTIGVARILSGGALFLTKKTDDIFLVVALKDRLNIPPNLTHPAKNVLKIDSCSGWGVHFVSCGAITHFPCKLRLKNFFNRPGGAGAPTAPPWLRLCRRVTFNCRKQWQSFVSYQLYS